MSSNEPIKTTVTRALFSYICKFLFGGKEVAESRFCYVVWGLAWNLGPVLEASKN